MASADAIEYVTDCSNGLVVISGELSSQAKDVIERVDPLSEAGASSGEPDSFPLNHDCLREQGPFHGLRI